MNRAWLIKRDEDDGWEIVFSEPERWHFAIKEIAWVELKQGAPE